VKTQPDDYSDFEPTTIEEMMDDDSADVDFKN
jgi:hypothetical protein